ncbi:GerAB/ArcD/ProY family transporter [Paenibacillus sp. AR247]|uniref:GerAB/ArcD/ProY family transporter n=1 Tax=Paenibacillus sp. AR247 TaxID=1631599 RepID=UPI000CFA13A7|nr:GerAB/ArcD/ProY family transporter [Paenibacillus sp. AR247]PQP89493.1 hypothetical protein CPT76_15665 [Paenibacillus sp. AR247]
MIDKDIIQSVILKPLIYEGIPQGVGPIDSIAQMCDQQLFAVLQTKKINTFRDAADDILKGHLAILADGEPTVLLTDVSDYETRSIEEPSTEAALRGTRESFTESLRTNTTMLRRIIVTPNLKMESYNIGKLTQTEVVLAYIEGIVSASMLDEIRSRVQQIELQGVLESGYIEESIEDTNFSPFPQMLSSERPDVVSSGLMEGRVGILVSGSPIALIVPMTFWDGLQAPDDYYERFMYVTMNRWIRYLFALFAILFPSVYIALTTFHPEMVPPKLMLSITGLREQAPFPTVIEVFIMEFMFEGLREAGIRLPQQIGPLVSIVGALVIGQAAVQAGIISAPIVIVVSAAGISSFVTPPLRFGYPMRMLLTQFSRKLLGGWIGRIVILPYFVAWLLLSGDVLRSFTDFIHLTILDQTPIWILMVMIMALAVYLTGISGITGIGRFCELAGPVTFIALVLTFLLNVTNTKLLHILPIIGDSSWQEVFKASLPPASFFGESFMLLVLLAFISSNKKIYVKALSSIAFTAIMVMLATVMVLLVFGPYVGMELRFSYFMLVRSINILNFIQNVDVLVIFIWIFGVFAKISLYLFITSYEMAQWLQVKNWKNFCGFVRLPSSSSRC